MCKQDIDNYDIDKINSISDFIDFWTRHNGVDYCFDNGKLIVWINFYALTSFVRLFGESTLDECFEDFQCYLRKNCLVFPDFINVLEHLDIDEEEIKEIFR